MSGWELLDAAGMLLLEKGRAFIGTSFAETPWAFFFNCSSSR